MTSPTVPHKISVLEVEELRLVDKDGSSLARLARDRYGSFGLVIGESANGRPMLALTIAATGEPCIEICDRQGNCRALLQINHATGQVAMGLLDGNQQARAQVTDRKSVV